MHCSVVFGVTLKLLVINISSSSPAIRDVPDIRFRFRLAGYPAVFFYPVPAPVPAEMVPGTGYLYRIVLGRFRQLVDAADCGHIVNVNCKHVGSKQKRNVVA